MVVLHQKKISMFRVQKIGQLNSRIGFSNSVVQLMNLIGQLMNLIFFKHKIFLKFIGGECKSATDEITSFWNETTLPTIMSNYKLQAIFNAISLASSTNACPIKPITSKEESSLGRRKVK